MDYPWYETVEDSGELQQGDFIPNCPIVIPPSEIKENQEIEISIDLIDSIVLTQSCDLANSKLEIVLVCPYYALSTFIESLPEHQTSSTKAKKRVIDNLRKGYLPGYHLLDKSKFADFENDYKVVDFKNVYGIQFKLLKEITSSKSQRIRLLPPYREHLSQAFARYFMRVGLPQDIQVEGY